MNKQYFIKLNNYLDFKKLYILFGRLNIKFKKEIDWKNILRRLNINEKMIEICIIDNEEKTKDWNINIGYNYCVMDLCWELISQYQNLSEKFIEKHKWNLIWKDLHSHWKI